MTGFADAFWTSDYATGLGVLFKKLHQGVTENQQVLTIASMRADAEEMYSQSLESIAPTLDRMTNGFSRDDGASVRKAYEGVRSEMLEGSRAHQKIASSIRELVVYPFSRWCDAHATRVQASQDDLMSKIKAHDRQADLVKKLRTQYFNKCRMKEDQEEENKLAFQDPEIEPPGSGSHSPPPKLVLPDDMSEELPVEIGDETYSPEQMKKLLGQMLETIPLGETKVPILGTYQNVSVGTDIVDFLQKRMNAGSVGNAERIGQDLVDRGFLRLVGNVGSVFANSSKMKYQWRPRVFQITGIPERKKLPNRVGTTSSQDGMPESPVIGNITETLQAWNPLNNPYPNETPMERLRREAKEADEKYKAAVRKLDYLRCNLEESMMDYLKFLERCELDRLKAIRSVILDFSGALSNSIPSLQSQVDKMMLYQETIQPLADLRYMLENYRTGFFIPKVIPYDNYYGTVTDQTFGVDLEARAKADKRRVPLLITTILMHLDAHYPVLEGDEARRVIWITDVPLSETHRLRNAINNGAPIERELLSKFEIPVVASVLKLYLLELPDSLVSSGIYELIKTIYSTTPDAVPNPVSSEPIESAPRIQVLQSALTQLRLNNIATLDALATHFSRLIDLTSADETYISSLAQALAPCILRPKTESPLTMEERHAYRLVRDLLEHKEAIFGELKRQASVSGQSGPPSGFNPGQTQSRARAVSTDESSRRANVEARVKAIAEQRTRDKSPAPASRHRRDKSTDGGMGRFPVVASPRTDSGRVVSSTAKRASLDVPDMYESAAAATRSVNHLNNPGSPPTSNGHGTPPVSKFMPGSFSGGGPGPHIPPPVDDDIPETKEKLFSPSALTAEEGMTKQNSLKRSTMISSGDSIRRGRGAGGGSLSGLRKNASRDLSGQSYSQPHHGVTLVDKPMDD